MSEKKLILIIDDDKDIIDSIMAILKSGGYEVAAAMNGQEGINVAITKKPDLILCDMMMEKIDAGSKTADELRKKGVKVPIFLLSSIGDATASNIEVDKLGFNGVFQKPVKPEHLLSTLKTVLKV